MTQPNPGYRNRILIMRTKEGWYPIEASGTKQLKDEAPDHAELNSHILCIEDIEGNVLWRRQ